MQISANLKNRLKNADKIVFLTGAGISAESGIPTFRGENGLWKNFRPEELANFNAFIKNPDLVWEWYQYRRDIVRKAKPNSAHLAITGFQKLFKDVTVITQNVDNLHTRAGNENVLELHGNIEKNYCIDCKQRYDFTDFSENKKGVPRCKKCGGIIRPDVVWFGESLPQDIFRKAENKTMQSEIFFVVGTSAVVYPAAGLAYLAKDYGSYVVEINIDTTDFSYSVADEVLLGKAGEVLPKILSLAETLRK